MTYSSCTDVGMHAVHSRIDRIYLSLENLEVASVLVSSYLFCAAGSKSYLSDHVPVVVVVRPFSPPSPFPSPLPVWVCKDSIFQGLVEEQCSGLPLPVSVVWNVLRAIATERF